MDARRQLPSIDRLLLELVDLPHDLARMEARALVDRVRKGEAPPGDWGAAVRAGVAARRRLHLRRVINATGIVLHTNLGRAPLGEAAVAAVTELAAGYSNLELDLERGERGDRLAGVGRLLRDATGAQAALAVNNNAAATLLMMSALAAGREVVVSRGELVEIGGGFRVPDVIVQGGARLREVGATNKTRIADYAAAIGPETAAILKVHPSNFRMVGFTEAPERRALAALAKERGVLYLEDLGSGALVAGLGEPTVAEVVGAGVDVVTFSGDKLLGGPQCGLAVGSAELIGKMRRHPLYRALRLDRLVLAALEATLRGYLADDIPPLVRMLRVQPRALRERAASWVEALRARGVVAATRPDVGFAGGGALPGEELPTTVVEIVGADAERWAAALRLRRPSVLVRVKQGALRVDPRAVQPGEDAALLDALVAVCGAPKAD